MGGRPPLPMSGGYSTAQPIEMIAGAATQILGRPPRDVSEAMGAVWRVMPTDGVAAAMEVVSRQTGVPPPWVRQTPQPPPAAPFGLPMPPSGMVGPNPDMGGEAPSGWPHALGPEPNKIGNFPIGGNFGLDDAMGGRLLQMRKPGG
jgi:hypothetical protein